MFGRISIACIIVIPFCHGYETYFVTSAQVMFFLPAKGFWPGKAEFNQDKPVNIN
jgi:hypothetical protein